MKTQKMNGNSHNPQAELLAKLQKEMPEIFSEGKIDFSKFKATLGENVVADGERYGLSWAGKSDCFRQIQETTTNTLKPQRDESVNFDDTENLFIEGDNLQAMKVLQKSYYGKIKMIYIDPPYNTGNDFIYNDKFSQAKREYLQEIGAIDELGNVVNAELFRQNTRDSGHFHSTWLNMMYPRLFLARNLLRQDGVIFVSIDDNEVANLRKMMDEIFGEENFVGQYIWKKRTGSNDARNFASIDHDYVICYGRSEQAILNGTEKNFTAYKNPDKDLRGDWATDNLTCNKTASERPNLFYPIIDPKTGIQYECNSNRVWAYEKSRMEKIINEGKVIFPKTGKGTPMYKRHKSEVRSSKKPFGSIIDTQINAIATKELRDLLGGQYFDHPKGVDLLKQLVQQGSGVDSIILDFFAGSGTTAHAVAQLNAEDGGNRKWICVQLPEKCKAESEAAKAGYATIADIAKERIRRASWQIFTKGTSTIKSIFKIAEGDDDELKKERKRYDEWVAANPKFGFKVFKLKESNFKVWNTQIENVEQLEQQMIDFLDNVREGATTEDLLYELILKSGHELNVPIEEVASEAFRSEATDEGGCVTKDKGVTKIDDRGSFGAPLSARPIEEKKADGQSYFRVGDGTIIICLADKMTKALFEAIVKDKPEKIITLDRVFGNNDQLKTNILLQAEHAGVKEFKVI
ncbi:site-specific DNA-methyltransferase [Candidatus Peregrinibacteria bacterium CG_4_10_14_0_2_um_filter_43_11]|nr:MAG: site-specific DNA-methyltransferase [Candidatus Peregrinibacteria bacterium CG_4_10_14_0_2_um_filter_43_11]